MTTDDLNPYVPPKDELPAGEPWKVDYFGGFSAAMQNPNWISNAFQCGIVVLIPILGQIVALGYAFDIAETLHRTHGRTYPDFSFHRFTEYLMRGVGPFLIQFIVGLVCSVPFVVVVLFSVFGAIAAAEGDPQKLNEAMLPLHLVLQPLQILMQVAILTVSLPLMTRSGISSDIGQAFQFEWGWQALSRTWLPSLLMMLVWQLSTILLFPLGCLLLCVGILPAIGYWYGVLGWYGYQFYRLALSQGLPPIPLKAPPAVAAEQQ